MNNSDLKLALKERLGGRKLGAHEAEPAPTLPLTIDGRGAELTVWASARRGDLESRLLRHGALLFRGFAPIDVEGFGAFVRTMSVAVMDYTERSSPRTKVGDKVFTSTDYPPGNEIFPHNENSYAHAWPRRVFFHCEVPALEGGETPLVDVRGVYGRLSPSTRKKFETLGVRYVRNFSPTLGLAWQDAFQTSSRKDVEEFCYAAGYNFEWKSNGDLCTQRVGQAVATHPATGERVWFNHATFFHVTTLDQEIRDGLMLLVREEDLPNNTYYGDGSAIEPEVLNELRAAYAAGKILFPWAAGDVLMVDNMLVAHGRSPYRGSRRVLVAMADPYVSRTEGKGMRHV